MKQATVWDRSRQLARQEILEAAVRLFTTQGYDRTTTSEIAAEAGVSQRTLFRYFGTKEDLVCGDQDALGELLRTTVESQPPEVSAWAALRAGFLVLATANHSLDLTLTLSKLIFATPSLQASYVQKRLRWQQDLLPAVRDRLGGGSERELEARIVIAVSFACVDASTATWVASDGTEDIEALYDQAITVARSAK
ncbi:helix-turn-helix domain-containing protein [Kribbella sp. NPDC056861]|uniref:TetR/AcrR family transcriptional regulator n=1 Tax=Kribbella sp. NPDC056861 TaxID=3154857 RepID=UPI0034463DDF